MKPDPERTGETQMDYYPPLTAQERRDADAASDPRRDWPTRQEAEEDAREDEERTLFFWRCRQREEEP